jgi:Flp pilus assembly pilin Flp
MSKKRLWSRLWRSRAGQGLTEYAMLIALVSLGLILILGRFRNSLGNSYRNSTCVLNGNSAVRQVQPGGGVAGASGVGTCATGGNNGNNNNNNNNGDDDDDD